MSYFANNSNLFSIQSAIEEFNRVITQQNAQIATLQTTMASIVSSGGTGGASIADLTALQTTVSDLQAAIVATNTIVSDHTTAIAALEVPGFVATPQTLSWDFRDFFDTKQGIEFVPIPSDGVEIIDQKAVVDLPGPLHYLRGFVPVAFVSKFSKTLMFRFKSIAAMDPNVDFVFSTFSGDARFALGFAIRVFNGAIETKVYGGYNPSGTKQIYSALHPIPGYPSVIFNQYVHMCVVINTATGFITTYINGVQAGSTNAVTSGTTQAELDAGEYHAGVSFLPFFVNKAGDAGDGNALYDQIDYFDNVALSQQDITYYYNESI
jgi:hypothetical protein